MSYLGNKIQKNAIRPLTNLGSGLLLRVFSPFSKGDFIEIDDQLGSVEKSGLQTTTIKKLGGGELKIENTVFFRKHLKNLTDKNIICLEMSVGIGYNSNMTRVKEEVLHFFNQQERLLDLPTPKIQVSKIKTDFVELVIKPWCLLDDFFELDSTLENLLKKHLVAKNFIVENEMATYSNSKMLA